MARNWHILVHFGEEFVHFDNNLFILFSLDHDEEKLKKFLARLFLAPQFSSPTRLNINPSKNVATNGFLAMTSIGFSVAARFS